MDLSNKATVSLGVITGLAVGFAISGLKIYRSKYFNDRLTFIVNSDKVQNELEEYSRALREHKKAWVN